MRRHISRTQNWELLKRNSQGQFTKRFDLVTHTTSLTDTSIQLCDLGIRKKVTAATYQTILSSGIITESTKYICKYCLNHFTGKRKQNVRDNAIPDMTDLDDETATCNRFIDLATEVQKIEGNVCKENMTVDDLCKLDVEWLADRPPQLV